MTNKHSKPFDSKVFLGAVGAGRTNKKYRKNAVVFHQGDGAESVFYILRGKIKSRSFRRVEKKPLSRF